MGHAIDYLTFDKNTSNDVILFECNDYANNEGADYHDPIGSIRYLDGIEESYDAAIERITKNDNGWYDNIGVLYKEPIYKEDTKEIKDLLVKKDNAYKTFMMAESIKYSSTVKSAFIGCKKCKSKMNREYIHSNCCPLCMNDFRSETTLKHIASLKNTYDNITKKIKDARYKNEKDFKTKILIKIEYHV